MKNRSGNTGGKISYRLLFILIFASFSLWLSWMLVMLLAFDTNSERAEAGDLFGGVNALFTALAFSGLIFSVIQTQQALRHQIEEAELTRATLEESTRAHTASVRSLQLQADNQILEMRARRIEAQVMYELRKKSLDNPNTKTYIDAVERIERLFGALDNVVEEALKQKDGTTKQNT
jgi:hypothetical protein